LTDLSPATDLIFGRMINPSSALRWKTGDEEAGDCITGAPEAIASDGEMKKKTHRRPSQRTIDPRSAIPIEYRSLYDAIFPSNTLLANIIGIVHSRLRMRAKESGGFNAKGERIR
jgi:hypothetical protein